MRQYLTHKMITSSLFGLFLFVLCVFPQSAFATTFSPRSFSNPFFFASSIVFGLIFIFSFCFIVGRFSVLS